MTDDALAAAFAKLGLAMDADAGAVRLAYARQLKQIDQATEIEAFQTLREAYELALAATRRGVAMTPTTVAATAAPQPETPVAASASAPFDDFSKGLAAGFTNTQDAAALLQATLSRLESLEAGAQLERQVAALLVRGWQAGHEFLFDAARDAFHWAEDRHHLLAHGETGALLQEALIEQQIFFSQPPQLLDRQHRLVQRLRDATPPSQTLRRDEQPLLRTLVKRYPHWLTMVAPARHIEHWLGGPEALQAALAAYEPVQVDEVPDRRFSDGQVLGFLAFAIYLAWRFFG